MTYLNYLNATWEDFKKEIDSGKSIILIPVGCIEEHGPHLPLNTDCLIAEKLCETVVKECEIILGPPIRFGVSRSTQGFPGTLEIRIDTLRSLTFDIIYSFASQGVKAIILFTWHGGSSHYIILREAAREVLDTLRKEKSISKPISKEQYDNLSHIYLFSAIRFFEENNNLKQEVLNILETTPYHAAELETSLMLYLSPKLVKIEKIKDLKEFPKFSESRIYLDGRLWMNTGIVGDASKATREKGEQIFNLFKSELSKQIKQIQVEII
ncbi:MAG: creatininase family protein [Promethearchaeota archaeon]